MMRMKKLECTDQLKIDSFLQQTETGYLGISYEDFPYVVPLNYVWFDGKIYFHGATEGKKMDIIRINSNVCFTVSESYGTMADPVPAKTDTAYMSVMIFGKAELLTDLSKATEVMQKMLEKYVPNYYAQSLSPTHVEKYRSSLGSKTSIIEIKPEVLSAKENQLVEDKRFYHGRKVEQDS
ncbi:pyridoxamine 5'-phosphate oxidase family protein [Bacillus sp. CGMCC 1.16607]|uniref:pyridoxamine 5'-phosphate oxidase family protein n=1 Tax=Bacillus sp. CGMCC 1.16607 TaxID=3351842 RepID=UPI00363C9B38